MRPYGASGRVAIARGTFYEILASKPLNYVKSVHTMSAIRDSGCLDHTPQKQGAHGMEFSTAKPGPARSTWIRQRLPEASRRMSIVAGLAMAMISASLGTAHAAANPYERGPDPT